MADEVDPTTGRIDGRRFAARYRASDDPYDLEHRWYERRKRSLTVACLGREHYGRAFEPGCATGLLTLALAPRCETLLAVDVAPGAVDRARGRLADQGHVTVARIAVPDEWPDGTFDLVVLSEIGYYLEPATLLRLRELAVGALAEGGELLAVHWRGRSPDHVLHGDEVHALLRDDPSLQRVLWHVEDRVVIESFIRN
jgi:SAM-dependent methyltransferase